MGLFYSRSGPRARAADAGKCPFDRRVIRLSLPLFRQLYQDGREGHKELTATLAHEMIHQWQYDILKRRPNHGPDFRRMMHRMNQDGLQITIYHSLGREIDALARYAWRCRQCGYTYRRRRRTIQPRRHRCGACRGPLQEMQLSEAEAGRQPFPPQRQSRRQGAPSSSDQLVLQFSS
jgi:predicted SprT family Zn-dependent metalloprotease